MKNKIMAKIEVKEMETFHLAYVRHIGSYDELGKKWDNLMGELMKWAGPRGLVNFPATKLLTVYHDDPKVTDPEKLRTSLCITVPEETEVNGTIGKMSIQGGKFAVGTYEISTNEFQDAWNSFCIWLPESGYQPDDKPCFEIYLNNPKEHPENKCIIQICMPVKPM
jgi:AraC family transcriptional regulator